MEKDKGILNLRTATAADVPAIIALEREAESAAHWSDGNYRDMFTSAAPRRVVLVVHSNEAIVAFAVARIVEREWEVENVVVAGQMRRQGIAFTLMNALIHRAGAEGADKIVLEVRESNFAARALYEKTGFAPSGLSSGYYRSPQENAICYCLDFLPSTRQAKVSI